jgi:hypothetical protein
VWGAVYSVVGEEILAENREKNLTTKIAKEIP